jgi:hypothetical protein
VDVNFAEEEDQTMADERWNPWKMTTIGMALVIATALVTGLVVANWYSPDAPRPSVAPNASAPAPAHTAPAPVRAAAKKPTAADVQACNDQAKAETGDKTLKIVKDTAIGGAVGAGVGAATGAIADGGSGAGKGAGVGGIVGLAAGALYGLNEAKAHDARYVEVYRTCMRGRGHTG